MRRGAGVPILRCQISRRPWFMLLQPLDRGGFFFQMEWWEKSWILYSCQDWVLNQIGLWTMTEGGETIENCFKEGTFTKEMGLRFWGGGNLVGQPKKHIYSYWAAYFFCANVFLIYVTKRCQKSPDDRNLDSFGLVLRKALNSATNLLVGKEKERVNRIECVGAFSPLCLLIMLPQRIWIIGCIVTLVATNLRVGKEKKGSIGLSM